MLEVGVGTGKNLPYYPPAVEIVGIDFSPAMVDLAARRAESLGLDNVSLVEMDAQDIDFADDTFDTVVSTCVFCSVPLPVTALRELRRVCRPGGQLLMLEHVRSEKPFVGPLMDLLNPLPLYVYGANNNRRTVENLERAGFRDIEAKNLWRDIVKEITVHVHYDKLDSGRPE